MIKKRTLICSGEEFYDMEENESDEDNNNLESQIQIKSYKKNLYNIYNKNKLNNFIYN